MDEDPLVVDVQAADTVHHDFSVRPASIPVIFNIRNTSAYRPTEYALLLNGDAKPHHSTRFLVGSYVGTLTHRGVIPPLSLKSIRTRMWVVRPGAYSLGGWRLRGRPLPDDDDDEISSPAVTTFMQDAGVNNNATLVMDISR